MKSVQLYLFHFCSTFVMHKNRILLYFIKMFLASNKRYTRRRSADSTLDIQIQISRLLHIIKHRVSSSSFTQIWNFIIQLKAFGLRDPETFFRITDAISNQYKAQIIIINT